MSSADSDSGLNEALAHYRNGRLDEAEQWCRARLAGQPDSPHVLHLLGLVMLRRGRHPDAIAALQLACMAAPQSAVFRMSLGNAQASNGNHAGAAEIFRQALGLNPGLPEIRFNLAKSLVRSGQRLDAAVMFLRLARGDQLSTVAEQELFELLGSAPADLLPGTPHTHSMQREGELPAESISIVICSNRDEKFRRIARQYEDLLGSYPHEIIRIADAASLCSGYARGFRQSAGSLVVFSHDDIDILDPDFLPHLMQGMARMDVLGIAGTTRLTGPAYAWGGRASVHGWLFHQSRDGLYDAAIFDLEAGLVTDIVALDGSFFCARREVVERVGFDSATFDGFHLYDIDFSYRAHRAGFRIGVTHDIVIAHESVGNFNETWKMYADRFMAKFPALRGERSPVGLTRASFANRKDAMDFVDRLRALCRFAGSTQHGAGDDKPKPATEC
jgi:tetratricopeptide (TPR) repeat protein